MKKILMIVLLAVSVFSLNSCDVANAEWKEKYEQEKLQKEAAIAAADSLEGFVGVLQENITLLYNTTTVKIDSLNFIISSFPDTNFVIARYKIIRDGQVITMLTSVNNAVLSYIDSIRAR